MWLHYISGFLSLWPPKSKDMKRFDLFCASPASTSICTSMDQKSMVRQSSSRTANRQAPHLINDDDDDNGRRIKSRFPFSRSLSMRKSHHQKGRKSPSTQTDLSSPLGSSRYLLGDTPLFGVLLSDNDPLSPTVPIDPAACQHLTEAESNAPKKLDIANHNQVVELKVSLHCKGCEMKVRKHISRMEGVTSFSVDFSTKKVTVIGNVTPPGVLASISKVKNAELWPSSP